LESYMRQLCSDYKWWKCLLKVSEKWMTCKK
jgi:hypothetical protein